jgi:hypothetical protein
MASGVVLHTAHPVEHQHTNGWALDLAEALTLQRHFL